MKRILMLILLSVLLYGCMSKSIVDCTEYKGPNECIKFPSEKEEIRGK